jgi:hypothetical protein
MIEFMEAATPLTNMRYTKNPDGAIYGYEQSLLNSFMNRVQNRSPGQRALSCLSMEQSWWWLSTLPLFRHPDSQGAEG